MHFNSLHIVEVRVLRTIENRIEMLRERHNFAFTFLGLLIGASAPGEVPLTGPGRLSHARPCCRAYCATTPDAPQSRMRSCRPPSATS